MRIIPRMLNVLGPTKKSRIKRTLDSKKKMVAMIKRESRMGFHDFLLDASGKM
jgi:hypothetical protein